MLGPFVGQGKIYEQTKQIIFSIATYPVVKKAVQHASLRQPSAICLAQD